ncbi:MAG TPA: hypothetical protein VG028_17130 [Terriglobia bacterium]|nr:hypothetical protein [Terriglobia bacterium]
MILIDLPTISGSQWAQEMAGKLFLLSETFDSGAFNARRKAGSTHQSEDTTGMTNCFDNFARAQEEAVESVTWDLVVIDEADRLRNVFESGNKIARAI